MDEGLSKLTLFIPVVVNPCHACTGRHSSRLEDVLRYVYQDFILRLVYFNGNRSRELNNQPLLFEFTDFTGYGVCIQLKRLWPSG